MRLSSLPLLVVGHLVAAGGVLGSIHLLRDGFSWWVLGTGLVACNWGQPHFPWAERNLRTAPACSGWAPPSPSVRAWTSSSCGRFTWWSLLPGFLTFVGLSH